MKKRLIFFFAFLLFVAGGIVIAQVTDTTAQVTYHFGDSLSKFLSKNLWTLIFVAFTIISEWLGQTGKVKEGSIYAVILNWIGKFIKSKGEVVASKKAKFGAVSKVLIFAVLLSGIGLMASAQGLLDKPSPADFKTKVKNYGINQVLKINQDSLLTSLNKWDIATGMNAVGFNLKTGSFAGFSSAGFGLVRSVYKLTSDKLTVYKTWSYGGMLLFGDTNASSLLNITNLSGKTDVGIMAMGGLGPVSIGPTYFFVSKTLLLNFQITITIQ